MANALKMALSEAILSLRRRGWSRRRIARELGVDRATVTRHLRAAEKRSNAANAPLGSEGVGGSTDDAPPASVALAVPAPSTASVLATTGSTGPPGDAGRLSGCAPWHDIIQAKLDLGLTAQRIYQDLVSEHGFAGSYYSVRRFVRRLGRGRPLPFRRSNVRRVKRRR